MLKQPQQKNLNKREKSNNTGVVKAPKTPTVSTHFLDGALRIFFTSLHSFYHGYVKRDPAFGISVGVKSMAKVSI